MKGVYLSSEWLNHAGFEKNLHPYFLGTKNGNQKNTKKRNQMPRIDP
jgi:hypothetical protein